MRDATRFQLFRSQFLQVNTRWKALDEIYQIYMHLHASVGRKEPRLNVDEINVFDVKDGRCLKTLRRVFNFAPAAVWPMLIYNDGNFKLANTQFRTFGIQSGNNEKREKQYTGEETGKAQRRSGAWS